MKNGNINKKKILLVYPETPETYWSFTYALPMVRKKSLTPPLALLTVAALLPEEWECSLVDLNVEPLRDRAILEADMVFLSAMIVQKDSFHKIVARCNDLGVPVAAGGPYVTSATEELSGIDHLFIGEGEELIPPFVEDVQAGTPKAVYRAEEKPDIRKTPAPRFDLVNMKNYNVLGLQFSRGCPFDCEFCDIVALFGRKTRTKTPEQFLREMDAAYKTGFRGSLFVVDDNFIGNKSRVKELLREVISWQEERNYPYTFLTEASVNLAADEELMDLMRAAGFHQVFLGIETPVPESLREINKGQNLARDLRESILAIQEKGLEVTAGFIVGFDSDPPEVFDLQIQFIQDLAIPTAMVGVLMALPNTRLYHRLKSEGRLRTEATGNNTHSVSLNFTPVLPEQELIRGYYRVISTLYEPKNYFDRCLRLLSRFKSVSRKKKQGKKGFAPWEILVLFRSLFRQSFSRYGFQYLRFMGIVLFRYLSFIEEAVTLAVQGHHFFTITRKSIKMEKKKAASLGQRVRDIIHEESYPVGTYKTVN